MGSFEVEMLMCMLFLFFCRIFTTSVHLIFFNQMPRAILMILMTLRVSLVAPCPQHGVGASGRGWGIKDPAFPLPPPPHCLAKWSGGQDTSSCNQVNMVIVSATVLPPKAKKKSEVKHSPRQWICLKVELPLGVESNSALLQFLFTWAGLLMEWPNVVLSGKWHFQPSASVLICLHSY